MKKVNETAVKAPFKFKTDLKAGPCGARAERQGRGNSAEKGRDPD